MIDPTPVTDFRPRESILVDPRGQIIRTITRELSPVTGTGTGGVIAAGENVERMALFFVSSDAGGFYVAPIVQTPLLPVASSGGPVTPILIHISTYPGLIFGPWYVLAPLGQVVRVFETDIQR